MRMIIFSIFILSLKSNRFGGFADLLFQESTPYPYPYLPAEYDQSSLSGLIIGAIVIVAIILIGVAIRRPDKES